MIGRMNDEIVKRYSLAEIAMLVIFILGLAIAQVIVKVRHRVILSAPIALTGAGLSVSMPSNPGWEYEKTWRYESGNIMVLVAQQQMGQSLKASIQWRYNICSAGGTAEEILLRRVQQSNAKMGTIETVAGPAAIRYTLVGPSDGDMPFFLGVVPLDFGRYLELQVTLYRELDFTNAEKLFQALAAGIHYQKPQELQTGKALVKSFWDQVTSNSLSLGKKDEQAFLIKTADNRPAGYGYYQYSTIGTNAETQIQLAAMQYEHNLSMVKSVLWFDGGQEHFTWKTTIQQVGMGQPRHYTLVQEPDGSVKVITDSESDTTFNCGALVLPEVLLPECAALLLESGLKDAVVVDVIASMGFVVPTVMQQVDIQKATARSEQIGYAIRIDFLNNKNSFEELYFDKDRHFIGRYEQQPLRKQLWELTTPDTLKQIFKDNFQPTHDTVAVVSSINHYQ